METHLCHACLGASKFAWLTEVQPPGDPAMQSWEFPPPPPSERFLRPPPVASKSPPPAPPALCARVNEMATQTSPPSPLEVSGAKEMATQESSLSLLALWEIQIEGWNLVAVGEQNEQNNGGEMNQAAKRRAYEASFVASWA